MGEEVLSDLMSFTNFNAELFTPGSPDQTAYNLGMRRVVLYILTQARATPQDIDRIARIVQSQQQDKLWEEEI